MNSWSRSSFLMILVLFAAGACFGQAAQQGQPPTPVGANDGRPDGDAGTGPRLTGQAALALEFQPPKGESRSSWEASRKDRISRPKSIDVDVSNPKVKFSDDDRAVVSFTQHYRSDSLKTSTGKTLVLAKSNGKWSIVEERVGR